MAKSKPTKKARTDKLWLYPISETSGYCFVNDDVETDDASFESFAEVIKAPSSGRGGDRWGIHRNRKHVKVGDDIVVYSCKTKDRPPLLVGLARVIREAKWDAEWEKWVIKIRWDRPTSLALCRSPVDATYLKDRLPSQKGAVMTLSPDLQRWARTALATAKP